MSSERIASRTRGSVTGCARSLIEAQLSIVGRQAGRRREGKHPVERSSVVEQAF
jgi:hypothetical protein